MTKSPGSEEPPIDLNDPDLKDAATKIQANFRGHIARKQVQHEKPKEEASGQDLAKEMDKLKTSDPPEEEIDIDLNDPAVGAAAAKIQASFRGHMKNKKPCDKK